MAVLKINNRCTQLADNGLQHEKPQSTVLLSAPLDVTVTTHTTEYLKPPVIFQHPFGPCPTPNPENTPVLAISL